jgi:hypothetical protein
MANLGQLIQAAITAWRDGRDVEALSEAEPATVELEEFAVVIAPLARKAAEPLRVHTEVVGSDGETLAEATVTIPEAP